MTRSDRRRAPAVGFFLASLAIARAASAESHRVAAVDPDKQLARALDIALSPWGAAVTQVHIDHPGAMVPMPVERAREIAQDTKADVVMWVSGPATATPGQRGGYAVWIYDVASDQASLRELTSAPPFDATTAAAVALSVKALLRFTVVAPPPERFGAAPKEPTWAFGLSAGAAMHFASTLQAEPRYGVYAAFWPAVLHHRWGVSLTVSTGSGVQGAPPPYDYPVKTAPGQTENLSAQIFGTLNDYAIRAAIGGRFPLRTGMAAEVSLGFGVHPLSVGYTVSIAPPSNAPPGEKPTQQAYTDTSHIGYGIEPQIALELALFGGFVRLAPWIGASLIAHPHNFHPESAPDVTVVQEALFTAETGIRAELVVQ